MSHHAWITLGTIAALFILLLRGVGPPDMIMLGGAVLLAVLGVITPAQTLDGMANPAVLTIGGLFIVSAALNETGALDRLGRAVFAGARTERSAFLRLAPQIAAASAFLNNTAVVAMFLKAVTDWCRRNRISPSRLLIPLSYFAILGGTCTLIGTSTNLVVYDLMAKQNLEPPMRFFEIGAVGVPVLLVGFVLLMTLGRRFLPDRRDLLEDFGDASREYLIEMLVQPGCALIGQTVEQASMRRLPGLFLIEITRGNRVIAPVGPDESLEAGDRLLFTGVVSTVVDLERIPGFVPAADASPEESRGSRAGRHYCEAVVSATSPLVGKNIRDANFRALYNAAVLAVHRGGARLRGRIGDIVIEPGDTLLLQTGTHFVAAHRNNPDFYLVSGLEDARPVRHSRMWLSLGLLALLVGFMISGVLPVVIAAMLVAALMIATGCISAADARRSLRLDILLTIVGALAVGRAVEASGLARTVAESFVGAIGAYGPLASLAAVYIVTVILTELVTNSAAAALVFPLGVSIASELGVDARPFAFAIAFAASASFATPFGYQTNLMVFGPGGYRVVDFLRIGIPMTIVVGVTTILLIPLIWPFQAA